MPNYLGQHFLKNKTVIHKIIAALDIQPNEMIIEVGPGHGELTIPLAAAAEKVGAKIFTIEKDAKLAEALRANVADKGIHNIEGIVGDVLEFLKNAGLASASGGRATRAPKISGNIPYYLTGHLLRAISELEAKPERVVFMVQQEVAERICAAPPRMNRLAASVQFWAQPKIIARVPRADFSPPPEVESAVIELVEKNGAASVDPKRYYAAVRTIFAQPRKTILNNLAGKGTKTDIAEMLAKLGIDPNCRPQDLTIENIAQIAAVDK